MEAFLIYLLKSAAILGISCSLYFLLLRKQTAFTTNRWFLVFGVVSALVLPTIVITETVWIDSVVVSDVPIEVTETTTTITPINAEPQTDWFFNILCIYGLGVLFFSLRFLIQLFAVVRRLRVYDNKRKDGAFTILETKANIAPFSFFNTIMYNPALHDTSDLSVILNHEKTHCRQHHSIDIIMVNILAIIQWCNPFSWWYKNLVYQNLEYLADASVVEAGVSTKDYGTVLIATVQQQLQSSSITNNFHQSLIKKRIVMLHNKKRPAYWKYALVLPVLGLFVSSFNTETVAQVRPNTTEQMTDQPVFIYPVKLDKQVKISSHYGKRKHPITHEMKMHNGIDFKAPKGTPVYAAARGKVTAVGYTKGYGNLITIQHQSGYVTRYGQLEAFKVKPNQEVEPGDLIGTVGATGLATGPHLHFEMLKNGKHLDPKPFIQGIAVRNTQKEYPTFQLTENTTQDEIKALEYYFNHLEAQAMDFDILNEKFSASGKLTSFKLRVKFDDTSVYKDMFSIEEKNDENNSQFGFNIKLKYMPEKQGIQLELAKDMFLLFNKHEVVANVND